MTSHSDPGGGTRADAPRADVDELLRQHRRNAGGTLEELAEASGVSVRAISDIERGRARGPQARTVTALADALGLDGAERTRLLTAARQGRLRRLTEVPELCALPADVPDFVGRDAELAVLDQLTDPTTRSPLVVVSGAGGLGKSALAVHAALSRCAAFPGGVLHVDLHGLDREPMTPREALGRMLQALGVRDVPAGLPERSELYGRLLTERAVLVLLDNARAEDQVRPLLLGVGLSTLLVTSRRMLSGLPNARRLGLAPMSDTDARTLLTGPGDRGDDADLAEIARLCGNYPLALRIVGNLLLTRPAWTPADLVRRLADSEHRIRQLRAGDLEVDAALALSYEQLDDGARLLFRRLSLAHAGAGAAAAAVLAGIDVREAGLVLDELVELNLLVPLPGHRVGMHDLVSVWAAARLAAEETPRQRAEAAVSLRAWLLTTATAAGRLFETDADAGDDAAGTVVDDRRAAERWLRLEESNWVHALGEAAAEGADAVVLEVARSLVRFSDRWFVWPSWLAVYRWSSAAAHRLGDARAEARLLNQLSWALMRYESTAEGLRTAERAGELAHSAGDLVQEAWSHFYRDAILRAEGATETRLPHQARAAELFEQAGDEMGAVVASWSRGVLLNELGRYEDGLAVFSEARRRIEGLVPDPASEHLHAPRAEVLHGLGDSLAGLGDLAGAEEAHRSALSVAQALPLPHVRGSSQRALALVLDARGDLDGSRAAWQAARDEFRQAGDDERVAEADAQLAALALPAGQERERRLTPGRDLPGRGP